MRRLGFVVLNLTCLLSLAACSDEPPSTAPAAQVDLAAATRVLEEVPTVTEIVPLTPEDDLEELLGAEDGYREGAVVYDSRRSCRFPGIECGALIEVWPHSDSAAARSEEILALQIGFQQLGVERHYRHEHVLLRVNAARLRRGQTAAYAEAMERL